jgi:hypothetical protein
MWVYRLFALNSAKTSGDVFPPDILNLFIPTVEEFVILL